MNAPGVLSAVEAAVIAANLPFHVRFFGQEVGFGYIGGSTNAVPLPTGPDAKWAEVRMPRFTQDQITSGNTTALRGTRRPEPLFWVNFFSPLGVPAAAGGSPAAAGVAGCEAVGKVVAGLKFQDSLGGVEFEAGVGTQQIGGVALSSGNFFQVQGWVRGLMLFSEAA